MNKFILVCPAGNLETVKVAVNNGAGAVYFGVENYNARNKVGFTIDEFIRATEYAHFFGVKVFITLNILISDEEFEDVVKLAHFVYKNGADAIIVQDLGLYNYLKVTTDIDIHLSTQAGIHNYYGAKVAEDILKCKHIVLSRETVEEDILKIKNNTSLNIEYFVHGALCVAFSGNCYYSSMLSLGSGNRGKCNQFCRKKYTVISNDKQIVNGYMLSTGDICMYNDIDKLKNLGINHFKIEGRNRRISYVGGVTNLYKKALDNNLETSALEKFQLLFNRGKYNKLYLNGMSDVVNVNYNNHIGIEIGEITRVNYGKFNEVFFTSNRELSNKDTIKLFDKNNEVCACVLNDLRKLNDNNYVFTTTNNKIKKSYKVNLIIDEDFEQQIIEKTRKLKLNLTFDAKKDKLAILKGECNGVEVEVKTENLLQEAKTSALSYETCYKQFSKLNETYFELNNLKTELENVFLSVKELNQLRRNLCEELTKKIIKTNEPKTSEIKEFIYPKVKESLISKICVETIDETLNFEADYFIISLRNFDEKLKFLVNKCLENNIKPYITLPIMARGKDMDIIETFLSNFNIKDVGLVINNIYGLEFLSKGYDIIAGEYMNVFNSYTYNYLKSLGVKEIILSPELNQGQYEKIPFGVVKMYGDMIYMCMAHCPKRTIFKDCNHCQEKIFLKDEKDSIFEIKTLKLHYCYNMLVSNNITNIIGCINPLKKYIKLDEDNLDALKVNQKFIGTKDKKFTYGILYRKV